jgi:signal peptidase I
LDAAIHRGRRVLIDRWPFAGAPRRWEAFVYRDERQLLSVKRVVALPGERVELRRGDVYIDGHILRKSLDEMRAMAMVVHDDAFRPQGGLPLRWRAEQTTGWNATQDGFSYQSPARKNQRETDWLTYHHWRCYANPRARTDEAPIADNYGYNQAVSRELHPVADLLLECRMEFTGQGVVKLWIHDGRLPCTVRMEIGTGQVTLQHGDWQTHVLVPQLAQPGCVRVGLGVFDRQAVLALDGATLVRHPLQPGDADLRPIAQPLRIGSEGACLVIHRPRIFRDLYYFGPRGSGPTWATSVGANEFLLLGDNVPISADSRQFQPPGVPRKRLIGRILELPHTRR